MNRDEITLFPFRKEWRTYSFSSFRSDLMSGFAIAFITLPQAMAYALLAGLPIYCGLFASIYASFITAWFGSSRHLITGPSTSIAILVQSAIAEVVFMEYRDFPLGHYRDEIILGVLTQLTFLVAAFQILAAGFRLGRLTHFVSHSVIVAYLTGTATAMVLSQLYPFFGIALPSSSESIYQKTLYLLAHLPSAHIPTLILGLACCVGILLLRLIHPKLPAGAIIFALAAGTIVFLHSWSFLPENNNILLVEDVGVLTNAIPSIRFPSFDGRVLNALLPVAFAIAVLSVLEATSVSKTVAALSGQHIRIDQEIFGLGAGNFVASLTGSLPISGNSSRTTMNFYTQGVTRIAALFNSFFSFLLLAGFSTFLNKVPLAAIAALLVTSSFRILNKQQILLCLHATRSDALVFVVTLASCIFFSLDVAFYVGVVLSIILYLKRAAVPHIHEYVVDDKGDLKNIDKKDKKLSSEMRVLQVEGELFFGAADAFHTALRSIAEDRDAKVIILQLRNARDMDATASLALQQFFNTLKQSGRYLVACGLSQAMWDVLSDSGTIDIIGKKNLFLFDRKQHRLDLERAIARARYLLERNQEK